MITYDHGITLGGLTVPSQVIGLLHFKQTVQQLTATLTSAGQTKITSLYGQLQLTLFLQ